MNARERGGWEARPTGNCSHLAHRGPAAAAAHSSVWVRAGAAGRQRWVGPGEGAAALRWAMGLGAEARAGPQPKLMPPWSRASDTRARSPN